MAQNGLIAFAADRMLTRGVTQTEPNSPKIYNWQDPVPVTVMWAGASTVFGEVVQACISEATTHPERIKTIQDYVSLYCDQFAAYLGRRAERAVLSRLGITRQTIVSSSVPNDRANRLVQMITEYVPPGDDDVAVIVAGHDAGGAHIWAIYNDIPQCHDVEGFACIGAGAEHADSQLRFAGYTRATAEPQEALIMAYFAKRRAESAPGVGKMTDVGIRFAGGPGTVPMTGVWMDALADAWDTFDNAERTALTTAIGSAKTKILALATPPDTPSAPRPEASAS